MLRTKRSIFGFTMIELLMTMMLMALMSSVALTAFIDFRRDGKIALLKQTLTNMRVGLNNQLQQVILKCEAALPPWSKSGRSVFGLMEVALLYEGNVTTHGLCTTAQVPNAMDRVYMQLPDSKRAKQYWMGVPAPFEWAYLPQNPFHDSSILVANSYPYYAGWGNIANHCNAADSLRPAINVQWVYDNMTGEIWPGTNTPGINECNF